MRSGKAIVWHTISRLSKQNAPTLAARGEGDVYGGMGYWCGGRKDIVRGIQSQVNGYLGGRKVNAYALWGS